MTRKLQNKILDDKIESNVNQYKVDRLNAEISAFSSGDLSKYEFLKRIDLNYKPNALGKARFEFSPLSKTFSTGLDKTAQGYQEEGIIKLLKDIRDGLAGEINSRAPGAPERLDLDRPDDNDDDDDDDDDDDGDDDDNMPDLETEEEAAERIAKTSALNKFKDKINNFDEMVRNKEDEFDKMFKDNENRLSTKLNNNVKKLKTYIKENNNKIFSIENKFVHTENKRDNLFLNNNQLYAALKGTANELYETKKRLDEAGDDINKKYTYIDKLKEIQEKNDYQTNEIKKMKMN